MNVKYHLACGFVLSAFLSVWGVGVLHAQGNVVKQGLKRAAVSGAKQEVRAAAAAEALSPSAGAELYRSLSQPAASGVMPEGLKRSLYGAAVKAGADRRGTLQFLYKIGAVPNKKYLGYTPDIRRTMADLQLRLGAASQDELFEKLAAQVEGFYPRGLLTEPVVFRGMFIQQPQDVAGLLVKGMPMSRVIQKAPAVAGPDAGLVDNPQFCSLCFGRDALEAMPYAFGQGIGRRAKHGFITVAVLKKPADLNVSGVWTLMRDVPAEEILDVLVYDARGGKWFSLRESAKRVGESK